MKIYTKSGDKGTTSLIGGNRIEKDSIRVEAYGTIDELNSYIGLCYHYLKNEDRDALRKVSRLLYIKSRKNKRIYNTRNISLLS